MSWKTEKGNNNNTKDLFFQSVQTSGNLREKHTKETQIHNIRIDKEKISENRNNHDALPCSPL